MTHGSSMEHDMKMALGPVDVNYDLRFIDAMRLHHWGAISTGRSEAIAAIRF